MPFWNVEGPIWGSLVASYAIKADDYGLYCPFGKLGSGSQMSLETGPTSRDGSGDWERMQPRNQQVTSNTLARVWIAHRGSVVKCARPQVRPFHKDDEAAQEHITERMRKLGERTLHDGRLFVRRHHQTRRTSSTQPTGTRRNLGPNHQDPAEENQWNWNQTDVRRRKRGDRRTVSTDQQIAPSSSVITGTARQETEGDHKDKRRRVDELEKPTFTNCSIEHGVTRSGDEQR